MQRLLRFAFPLAAALGLSFAALAQTAPASVGIGTAAPDASAVLDLTSVTQGLLAPRMTASQRAGIQAPAPGLLVYQTDGLQMGFWYYTGAAWTYLNPTPAGDNLGSHTATQNMNLADKLLVGNGGTQGLRLSSTGQAGLGGATPANWLDIQGAGRTGTHPSGRPLYVTGDFDQAANGVEFRHSNATQGVGIGYNSLYAAGTNTDQNLNLLPKGAGSMGIGTVSPAASALVDMTSTTKGFLPPRLTSAQRDAIQSPAAGLTVFNLETQKLNTYNAVTGRWTDAVQSVTPGTTGNATFNYTGGTQTWTVPAGVTSLQVDMAGAQGRYFVPRCGNCAAPGLGGRVQATLAVQPGQVLTIEVGGAVVNGSGWLAGGYNGGGSGSYPGGGATDIRIGGTALTNRVLVAGGGGGGFSTTGPGGAGGGLTGGSAGNATGGSQSAGGQRAGNPAQYCYCTSTPADLGVGGGTTSTPWATAGGGGGYYGGGASHSDYSGGGGGSSYADPGLTSNVTHTQGARGGSGFVTFSFNVGPEAPYLSLSNATTSQAAGSVIYSDGAKLAGNAGQLYWDAVGTRLGIGTGSPQAKLHVAGEARISGLAGGGARMVTTDNNGQLAAQPLPTDAQALTLSGQQLSISGGNAVTLPNGADNLGNHAATQNLNLAGNKLVNGGSEGLGVTGTGGLLVPAGVIQRGGPAITATSDLGLYSRLNGNFLRLVTNNAPIRFYADDDAGTTANVSFESNGHVGIGTGNNTPANRLDVQTTAGRSGSHASGRPLYVTGDFDQAAGGSEFRHYNGTQGVGIGYNSLYAAGSNADQPLNLMPKGSGGVGIGTTSPAALLDVNGSQLVRGSLSFGAATRQMINLWNQDYGIGIQGGTQYFRTGEAFAWYAGGSHHDTQFNAGGGSTQMVLKNSFLGIGAGYSNNSGPSGPLEIRRDNASPYLVMHDPNDAWFSFGMDFNDGRKIKISEGNGFGSTNYMTFSGTNVGIGTTNPSFPLDVQGTVTPGNYAYGWFNGSGATGYSGSNTGPVSIRAAGRVVATEFNATSDRRLKTVIGLSDNAADLALLNQLRITDYTLRDRVQYGPRRFKKVIAQEVEQVFPQAVTQHSGFLPDIYAQAARATLLPGDSLLQLTLPAAPATAPKAGQRVKLITQTGEVTATVKAINGPQLVLRGARQLAGQQVFVFGLEHPDVRAVDYEALSMLNVSATQELARKVADLEKQNAQLRQQNQAQGSRLDQQQASLQTQASQTAALAQRLKALENHLLGAQAQAH
ncbi:glycine-rich protein [Hymenobacter edaphi]|uniref:receptor protein-tyrosine kinase n=1 Tax=Hymenobacter edaphi TaxID=2211146 RepID=A0A328BT78_9BACT|nr:glycine-rich protein [Hymenobacter edaphi]RAK70337.1 hypothetical protein DLM85_05705 [Hymenobacter edaphi]